jgi:hypothetical protein
LLKVLNKSPDCRVYHEGSGNNAAYDCFRLRPQDTVKRLIEKSREPTVVFKPVLDLQHTDRLLELHPNTKAIWIYRDYRNVVLSSVKKWQGNQKDIIYGIAADIRRDPKHHQYAIGERMSDDAMRAVRNLSSPSMSAEDGAALLWYVRNLLYFDLKLYLDQRVALVKYEDFVTQPQLHFQQLFNFVECDFKPSYVRDIFDTSVKPSIFPALSPEVELLCREMMTRMHRQYSVQGQSLQASLAAF